MIFWCPQKYGELTEIPDGIDGIVLDNDDASKNFYDNNKEKLPNSVLLIGESWSMYFVNKYKEIKKYYIDEPISNGHGKDYLDQWAMRGKTVFGEPDRDFLLKYKDVNCKVSYSAYREYIKIFGIRIPLWWTNQMPTWEWMQKEFGDKFSVCWIKKGQKDFDKLVEWAVKNKKEIWIYK